MFLGFASFAAVVTLVFLLKFGCYKLHLIFDSNEPKLLESEGYEPAWVGVQDYLKDPKPESATSSSQSTSKVGQTLGNRRAIYLADNEADIQLNQETNPSMQAGCDSTKSQSAPVSEPDQDLEPLGNIKIISDLMTERQDQSQLNQINETEDLFEKKEPIIS